MSCLACRGALLALILACTPVRAHEAQIDSAVVCGANELMVELPGPLTYEQLRSMWSRYEKALRAQECREAVKLLQAFLGYCPVKADSLAWRRFVREFNRKPMPVTSCMAESLTAPIFMGQLRWLAEYPLVEERLGWAASFEAGGIDNSITPIPLWKGVVKGNERTLGGAPRHAVARVLIDSFGHVREVILMRASGNAEFDQAAMEAACESMFTPAIYPGVPPDAHGIWMALPFSNSP